MRFVLSGFGVPLGCRCGRGEAGAALTDRVFEHTGGFLHSTKRWGLTVFRLCAGHSCDLTMEHEIWLVAVATQWGRPGPMQGSPRGVASRVTGTGQGG